MVLPIHPVHSLELVQVLPVASHSSVAVRSGPTQREIVALVVLVLSAAPLEVLQSLRLALLVATPDGPMLWFRPPSCSSSIVQNWDQSAHSNRPGEVAFHRSGGLPLLLEGLDCTIVAVAALVDKFVADNSCCKPHVLPVLQLCLPSPTELLPESAPGSTPGIETS